MRTVTKAPPLAARHTAPISSTRNTHEMATAVVEPAAVLPEQFFATPSSGYQSRGAYVLMRAVLEDALLCFEKQFVCHGQKSLRLAHEAEAWIWSNDTGWPFAFVNVCAALGLAADSVRRQVALRREGATRPLRRGRRRVVVARTPLSLAA
jgi:hypothetical protein